MHHLQSFTDSQSPTVAGHSHLRAHFTGRPNKSKLAANQGKFVAGSRHHTGNDKWRWTPFWRQTSFVKYYEKMQLIVHQYVGDHSIMGRPKTFVWHLLKSFTPLCLGRSPIVGRLLPTVDHGHLITHMQTPIVTNSPTQSPSHSQPPSYPSNRHCGM